MTEEQHQEALFKWSSISGIKELSLMFAVPNGGLRNERVAQKLKRCGVKSGVPDIFLPVARGSFHGLFIELKRPKEAGKQAGRPTKNQLEWLGDLAKQGYMAVICYGWDSARETILSYLHCEDEAR